MFKHSYLIVLILVLAALIRLAGLWYGLPLRTIADEPQFILAAIAMVQEGTLLPPAAEEFRLLLYSPPYPLYLLLFPVWVLEHFFDIYTLSPFFAAGRFISVLVGVSAVWLMYLAARRLWPQNPAIALWSAYFLATSVLAIALSVVMRHWVFAMGLAAAGLMVLSSFRLSFPRRSLASAAIAGIGMGFNQAVGILLMFFASGWYLLKEKGSLRELLTAHWFYKGLLIFLALSAVPLILLPESVRGVSQEGWGYRFTVAGFLYAPLEFLGTLARSEPVLMLAAAIGFTVLWRKERNLFWLWLSAIIGYIYLFYFGYQFQHRFLAVLLPFFAIAAGFGSVAVTRALSRQNALKITATGFLVLLPLISALSLGALLFKGDSRMLARTWFEENIREGSRVLVWADLMRLFSERNTIHEKVLITDWLDLDDQNEYGYPTVSWGKRSFGALNLAGMQDDSFFRNINAYACVLGYEYLVAQESLFQLKNRHTAVMALAKNAELLVSFGVSEERYSMRDSQFSGSPLGLFKIPELGPPIKIYRLNRELLCADDGRSLVGGRQPLLRGRGTARRAELQAYPFNFNRPRTLYAQISTDKKVLAVLATEEEFKKASKGEEFAAIRRLEEKPSTIAVDKGKYVFMIFSPEKTQGYTLYTLNIEFE